MILLVITAMSMRRLIRVGVAAPRGFRTTYSGRRRGGSPSTTEHGLDLVEVVLHGGEPLLVGVDGLRGIITELHSALRGVCELDFRIHTNGVRLSEAFCDLFAEFNVRVGISLDGDRAANDRHRRYANGRSSYDPVVRAINLLRTDRYRSLYAGLRADRRSQRPDRSL